MLELFAANSSCLFHTCYQALKVLLFHSNSSLIRPYVIYGDLQEGYRQMAAGTEREAEAREWIEGMAWTIRDEAR